MTLKHAGHLIEPRYQPGIGWVAEVFAKKGGLLHTTSLRVTRADVIEAAKAWLKEQKEKVQA